MNKDEIFCVLNTKNDAKLTKGLETVSNYLKRNNITVEQLRSIFLKYIKMIEWPESINYYLHDYVEDDDKELYSKLWSTPIPLQQKIILMKMKSKWLIPYRTLIFVGKKKTEFTFINSVNNDKVNIYLDDKYPSSKYIQYTNTFVERL